MEEPHHTPHNSKKGANPVLFCGNGRASVSNKWCSRCKSSVGRYCHGSCLLPAAGTANSTNRAPRGPHQKQGTSTIVPPSSQSLFPVHSSAVDPTSLSFWQEKLGVCGWAVGCWERRGNLHPAEASNLLPPTVFPKRVSELVSGWVSG